MKLLIRCVQCKKLFSYEGKLPTCCEGTPYFDFFEPISTLEELKKEIGNSWVTLGLFKTPTVSLPRIAKHLQLASLYAKCEHFNPTGSFKDRESEVAVNIAKKLKKKEIAVISSGNAAVSAAAYACKAGIICRCYVPQKTSGEKIELINKFGGRIRKIEGFFEDVYRKIVDSLNVPFHVSAGQNPFRELGDEPIYQEIMDDIGEVDGLVIPIGNGSLLSGIFRGCKNLKRKGLIRRYPKFIGVQIKGAAPISTALKIHSNLFTLEKINDSIAEGIVAKESYCSPKVVQALKETRGMVIEVTDKEIHKWLAIALKDEALCLEPTSAVVFPALEKCRAPGLKKVAVIATGTGLKYHAK